MIRKRALSCVALLSLFTAVTPKPVVEEHTHTESAQSDPNNGVCAISDGSCALNSTQSLPMNMVENTKGCSDTHHSCPLWMELGDCETNPSFMFVTCPFSCKSCLSVTRRYGTPQKANDVAEFYMARDMHHYMTTVVHADKKYAKVRRECRNQNVDCLHWRVLGECEANPSYMTLHCAPACNTCHLIDFDHRCPRNPDAPQVWTNSGELDSFFLRLVEVGAKKSRKPHILSTPAEYLSQLWDNDNVTVADQVFVDGPWVLTLDLLTDAECEHLIELGHKMGYRRSKDVGPRNFDGSYQSSKSSRRTSTNAWCSGDCFTDPIVQDLTTRVEQLLSIPTDNSEYWQLLRYEEGQEYKEHHDYIAYQRERNTGVRILTVFFYLNDVERGGGTHFPRLNRLTVTPKAGQVLIWPSVLDSDPNKRDPRTHHAALPVEAGVKYGANAWIHQSDYRTPHHQNCA